MRTALACSLFLAATIAATPAAAQVEVAPDGRRVISLVVYGNDACPPSNDGEVVVCSRRPEEERYRLPRNLRDPTSPATQRSWATRQDDIREAAATGTGSCSTVGPGGSTGCTMRMVRKAREENKQPEPVTVVE
jgi:hypothetical protein